MFRSFTRFPHFSTFVICGKRSGSQVRNQKAEPEGPALVTIDPVALATSSPRTNHKDPFSVDRNSARDHLLDGDPFGLDGHYLDSFAAFSSRASLAAARAVLAACRLLNSRTVNEDLAAGLSLTVMDPLAKLTKHCVAVVEEQAYVGLA